MEHQKLSTAQQSAELQVIERKCKKCLKIKPLIEYNKDKLSPGGFKTLCKKCRNESRRKTDRLNNIPDIEDGFAFCFKCKNIKKLNADNFHKSKITKNSKCLNCKECVNKANVLNAKKQR